MLNEIIIEQNKEQLTQLTEALNKGKNSNVACLIGNPFCYAYLKNTNTPIAQFYFKHKTADYYFYLTHLHSRKTPLKPLEALFGYYILRHYVSINKDSPIMERIWFLLNLPEIKALILLNLSTTELPLAHPLEGMTFANRCNELVRMTLDNRDNQLFDYLLIHPDVAAVTNQNKCYDHPSMLLHLSFFAPNQSESPPEVTDGHRPF